MKVAGVAAEVHQKRGRQRECQQLGRDFFQRDMIRSNPTMSSEKFKEALEELKQHSIRKTNTE